MAGVVMFVFVTLSVLSGINCLQMEPQCVCSKYHYEEQVLEKMIRTEIKFEELQRTLDNKMQKLTNQMEKELEKIGRFRTETEELFKSQETKLGQALSGITSLAEKIPAPDILFKSRTLAKRTYSYGEIVVFTNILFNYGDGYDKTTGVFTAPANGTYLFTAQLCADSGKEILYRIVVDGSTVSTMYARDPSNVNCVIVDAIVKLNSKSKVWVKADNSMNLFEQSNIWDTFSGTFLR